MESECERFKKARKELRLTLQALAMKTGYSVGTISGVENGHDVPSRRLRDLLVDRLLLNENWVRTGRGEMFREAKGDAIVQANLSQIYSPEEEEIQSDPNARA